MVKYLKLFLIRALSLASAFPTRKTDPDHLRSLLRKLHPVAPRQGLVRLGPTGDGGYLVPDDLADIRACFSPGVSLVSGFERDCADRGMEVFMADKSVDRPAEEHALFHFTKMFVGASSNGDFVTLDDWVEGSLAERDADLMLQIDVEGFEYEVFLSTTDALMRRFRIIVAEFHQLDQLWNRPFFDVASRAFEKILHTHRCVHIHPNNCCGSVAMDGLEMPRAMEFTFLRRDRIDDFSYRDRFPNALDRDNTTNAPLPLPRCWYRNERDRDGGR